MFYFNINGILLDSQTLSSSFIHVTKSKSELWIEESSFFLTVTSLTPLFHWSLINDNCWKTCGIKFFHPNQLPSLKKRAFHSRERTVTIENSNQPSHHYGQPLSTLRTLSALIQADSW